MREIKFRIWDYKHNMFYTWEEISSGKLRNRLEYFLEILTLSSNNILELTI